MRIPFRIVTIATLLVLAAAPAAAQEMEPKAYSASPVGATFLVAAISRSTGSVVLDPTLPIQDIDASINGVATGLGTTFSLFGKLALISGVLPYAWGDVSGQVFEETRSISRAGLADTRFRLSVNLRGNDAMRLREFAKTPRRTIVGTSVTVSAPTGEYFDDKLINLGNHRWAFKPEVGLAVPRGRWDIDAYFGVWLFTANHDYFPGGLTRTQDPVATLQGHVSYTFKPRLWLALDGTWYSGGGILVEGSEPVGGLNNSRLGATLSIPAGRQQSFKFSYSSGVAVRTGTDFRTLAVGWQWLWLRP